MAAFVHHNGPVSAGINANVFGLREKGCEKTGGACCVHMEHSLADKIIRSVHC